jgi:hypothetical protein
LCRSVWSAERDWCAGLGCVVKELLPLPVQEPLAEVLDLGDLLPTLQGFVDPEEERRECVSEREELLEQGVISIIF